MTKRSPRPIIVQPAAAWPLQVALVALVFTTLAVGVFSSVLLVDNAGSIAKISETQRESFQLRDERLLAIEQRLNERTDDRYRGEDARADLAKRDEQIELLWKNIKRLERRK